MKHNATLDKTAMVTTVSISILFALIIAGQFVIIKEAGRAIPVFTSAACLLIYSLILLFRPIDYMITAEEIIVRRLLASVHIKRSEINSATLIEPGKITDAVRTFGVGGMFGYWGSFANLSLGKMSWYTTRKDKPVLLTTRAGKKIVLSPDNPNNFLAELNA